MSQTQGYLDNIGTKQGQGKRGPYTAYSINVGGKWYNCGFEAPAAQKGDYISFDLVQKGHYTNAENVKAVSAPAASAAPKAAAPAAPPKNTQQVSISYQHCQKEAQRILATFLEKEVVKLPAKQADKFDAALALINEISDQLYIKLASVIENGGVEVEDIIPEPEAEAV